VRADGYRAARLAMCARIAQVRNDPPRRRRLVVALLGFVGCAALAALSLLVPSAPTTDSWGWLLWGREVANFELSTDLRSAPSWKPLPVLLTTPLSLAGDAAPALWVLLARSVSLAGVVLAFLLAGRLAGVRTRWLFAAAGVLAVIGILATRGWVRDFAHGYSEPLALALLLAAIERHLSGRGLQALLLGAAVATTRPEAFWPAAAYGAVLVWRSDARLPTVAAILAVIPALWLIPDWIGSGDLFHGLTIATGLLEEEANFTFGLHIVPAPLVVASIAGTALALWQREAALIQVAGLAWGWYLALRLAIVFGYPTAWRYFFLPASLLCVVGASGFIRLTTLAPIGWIRAPLAAAALAVVALSVAPLTDRWAKVAESSITRAQVEWDLWQAVTRAGGADLSRCGRAVFTSGFRWMKGVVSWRLDMSLRDVRNVRSRNSLSVIRPLRTGAARRAGSKQRGAAGPITVFVPPEPAVMFLPFAGMRIKPVARTGHPRFGRLGSYGQWLVATSDPAGCRASLTRKPD
jgi:hypothetical protein